MNAFFFSNRLIVIAAAAAGLAGVAGTAQAVTATAAMPVSATVPASCTATATSLAFGSLTTTLALAVTQADAAGSVSVTCTSGASYSVVAGDGNNYSSGWRMANGSSQYLTYGLYTDTGRATAFPRSGTTVAGTGSGAAQTVNVYGRVPAQTAGGFGNFTDSVTFSVNY